MRKRSVLLLLIASGCGAAALDRSAYRHEERAQVFARLGDGRRAEWEQRRAESLRATAQIREQRMSHLAEELYLR